MLLEDLRADDPAAILEGPRRAQAVPKVLTIAEVDALIEAARAAVEAPDASEGRKMRAARLYALVELLYATGLRVSELVGLPRTAARGKDGFISVRGKGGRERLAPLTPAAREAIADYRQRLKATSPDLAETKWLFPADAEAGHLTRQAFARDLKTLAAGAVRPKDGFPFALKAGADFLCVGMYDFQLVDNVNLFNEIFPACQKRDRPWRA